MPTTEEFSITLPSEMAARVRERVASGEYASESEVIREGLRTLDEREMTFAEWVRREVVPACEALDADPDRGLSSEQVRTALTEAREHRRTARS